MKGNGEENGKDWRTIGLFKKSERSLKETIRPICSLSLSHSHPHSLFRIQTGKGIPSRVDGRSESKMKKKKRKTSWKNPKRTGIRVRALRNDGQTIRKASDSTNNAKYGADNDGLAWVNHVTRVHRADVGKSFCKWTLERERERERGVCRPFTDQRGLLRRGWTRVSMPMDNPALSLLLVQQSTQRKREIPCGVSSGESTRPCTHRRLSNEGERYRGREEGASVHSRQLYLSLSLSLV